MAVTNPQLPLLGQCAKYLKEEWSSNWIDKYQYDDDFYTVFGANGVLRCFYKGTILIAQELNCQHTSRLPWMNKHVREAALGLSNLTVNIDNCLHINRVLTSHEPGQSGYFHSMIIRMLNRPTVHLCYMIGNLYRVPKEIPCPGEIKWARIDPRNFMVKMNGTYVFRSPTWNQYMTLHKMNHPSVIVDDYDYEHENDYFVSDWQ